MTKKNFVTLILGTVGGILFSLGMCMALVEQWSMLNEGIVVGAAGALILLVMALLLVYSYALKGRGEELLIYPDTDFSSPAGFRVVSLG